MAGLNSALDYCPTGYADCTIDIPDLVVSACKGVGVELIDMILMGDPDAPGFSSSDYASVSALNTAITARLKQTGSYTSLAGYSGNAALRKYEVFDATKPFVEPALVTAFKGQQFAKRTQRTIEFVDYDNSAVNHNWHNLMNCYKQVRIWYAAGDFLYGGMDGLIVSWNSWHGIVDNSDKPSEGWTGRLSWNSRLTEGKIARPAIV